MVKISTVTNLGFTITSAWDPAGLTAARDDIDKFQAELKAMSDNRVEVSVSVEGTSEVQAQIDSVSKERETLVKAKADTVEAQADLAAMSVERESSIKLRLEDYGEVVSAIEEVSKDRETSVEVVADTAGATEEIDTLAKARRLLIQASLDSAKAGAEIDAITKPREVIFAAIVDGINEARMELDDAALERHATIHAILDGITEARMELDDAARPREAVIKTVNEGGGSGDSSSALSSVSGLLTDHIMLVGMLAAAWTGLGAVAALVGGAMLTALGGGVIAAGMAVIEMNKKMTDSQNQAIQSAQDQANVANTQVVAAQQNVTQTAVTGAQNIVDANRAVSDAQRNVADTAQQGADSIRTANEEAASANQTLQDSETSLSQAYQDATNNLETLQLQQSQTGDNAESASIAVQKARDALAKGPAATSTDPLLDERELRNQLALAIDHQNTVLESNGQLNQKANEATQQGIDGAPNVIKAQQAVGDAQTKSADAARNVTETAQKAAENNAKAQEALGVSVQKASQAQTDAANANTKAQQQLTDAITNADKAQVSLSAAMQKANSAASSLMSQLAALAQPLVGPLHDALQSLEDQLTFMGPQIKDLFSNAAPLVQPFLDAVTGGVKTALPGMTSALGNMKDMMPGFVSGMTSLGSGVGGMFDKISDAAGSLGKVVSDLGANFGHFLDLWGGFIKDTGPEAATTLDHMGQGINALTGGVLGGMAGAEKNMSGGQSIIGSTFAGVGNVAQKALPAGGTMSAAVSSTLAPAIQTLTPGIGDALTGVFNVGTSAAKSFGPGLDTVAKAIENIVEKLKPLIPLVQSFASSMGGTFSLEMKILAPVVESLAGALAEVLKWMGPIIPVLGVLAVAYKTWAVASDIAKAAMVALKVVMATNPIILVGIAIAALVTGIVYLATKTQFFQDVWRDAWGAIKVAFDAVWGWIKDQWYGFIDDLTDKWTTVKQIFLNIVQGFKTAWDDVWSYIKSDWDTFSKIFTDAWTDAWAAIQLVFDTLTKWFTDQWTDLWYGIKVIWDTLSAVISSDWAAFWDGIKTVASVVWDGITTAFHNFGTGLSDGFKGIVKLAEDVWDGIKKVFADPLNVVIGFFDDTIGKVTNINIPKVTGFVDGGQVSGPGGPKGDKIPAMLSDTEFVVNADSTQKNLDALHYANNGGMIAPVGFSNGGQAGADPNAAPAAVQRALDWASSKNGQPYNADGWIDCSGLASGIYDSLMNKTPQREFTTVSDFVQLGFNSGTGGMMEIGVLPKPGNEGHMAVTLAGHNIESAGQGKGIQVDGSAWGADNSYFTDHYYLPGNMFNPAYSGPGAIGAVGKSSGGILGVIGSAVSSAVGAARGTVADLFEKLTQPLIDHIPNVPGLGAPYNGIPKTLITQGRDDLAGLIAGHSMSGNPVGGVIPTGDHLALIDQALALTKTPPPGDKASWEAGMNTLITRESGWNSAAINLTDSNAAAGIPSKGLAQTIDPTFNANAVPGHTDIWDPVSNIAAAINYIKGNPAYGDITNVQQANANMPPKGYATGTTNATPGMAQVGENGPELIKSKTGSFIAMGPQAVSFKGGETVTPLSQLINTLTGNNAPASTPTTVTQIPTSTPGTIPAPPPPSGGQQTGTTGDPNTVLTADQAKAQTALNAFGTANLDQAGTDLGVDTSGKGFIPQLFTQSFSVGQQLAQNMQNHVGIFGNQADTTGKNGPAPANTGSTAQKTVQGPTDVHFHTVDVGAALKQWTQQVKTQSMGFNPFGAM